MTVSVNKAKKCPLFGPCKHSREWIDIIVSKPIQEQVPGSLLYFLELTVNDMPNDSMQQTKKQYKQLFEGEFVKWSARWKELKTIKEISQYNTIIGTSQDW